MNEDEKIVLSSLTTGINKNGRAYTEETLKRATRKLEKKLFESLKPLTEESFGKTVQSILDKPMDFKIIQRIGTAVMNAEGEAIFVNDPQFREVLILRQFTELGVLFQEKDLEEFASNAVGQTFDVDWLCERYPQDSLEQFKGKGKEFEVTSVSIGYYAYEHKKMEKAIYAVGTLFTKGMRKTGTFATRRFTGPGPQVFVNGVQQVQGIDYDLNSNGQVEFKTPMNRNDNVTVEWDTPASVLNPCGEILLEDVRVESVTVDPHMQTMNINVVGRAVQPIEQIVVDINLNEGESE